MLNLTTHNLRLITRKRGIKNYQNMSREMLLSTLDESECIFENLSQNRLERIAKMENLSRNELKQITKMQNLSQNELQQIAKKRSIKNYNNMSREELLIALLKSKLSRAELYKSKSNNAEIEETRKIFNEIRNKFSKSVMKEIRIIQKRVIRKELHEKEKGLESEDEQERKQHANEFKKIKNFLEGLREEIKKTITNQ